MNSLFEGIQNAKQVSFDADFAFDNVPTPIEVKGIFQGQSYVAIQLLKDGKEIAKVAGDPKSAGVVMDSVNQYAAFDNTSDPTAPPGAGAVPYIGNKFGAYSAMAYVLALMLVRRPNDLIDVQHSSNTFVWQTSDTRTGDTLVRSDKMTLTGDVAAQMGNPSFEIDYTPSDRALKRGRFVKILSLMNRAMSVTVTFNSFSATNNSADMVDTKEFAFVAPAGATQFMAPAPATTALKAGSKAPEFSVVTPEGRHISLSSFRGKVIVIDLWATWCGPCQMSLPVTDKIAQTYQAKGVVFLPVCVWDTKPQFNLWLSKHKAMKMRFLFDPESQDASFASVLYKVDGIPTQFVVGKDGKIVATLVGYSPDADPKEQDLTTAINKALTQKT